MTEIPSNIPDNFSHDDEQPTIDFEDWGEKSQQLEAYKIWMQGEVWDYLSAIIPDDVTIIFTPIESQEPEDAGLMILSVHSNNSGSLERFVTEVISPYLRSKNITFDEDSIQVIPAFSPDLSALPPLEDEEEAQKNNESSEERNRSKKDLEVIYHCTVSLPTA